MTWFQNIIEHYAKIWGSQGEPCIFEKGPVKDLGPDFEVRKYAPHLNRNMWTFATCRGQKPRLPQLAYQHGFCVSQKRRSRKYLCYRSIQGNSGSASI
jgi:hypothetical protein